MSGVVGRPASVNVPPASQAAAATPSECLKAVREFDTARSRQARALPQATSPQEAAARQEKVAALLREVETGVAEMLAACAARFDVGSTPGPELASLADLYMQTGKLDLARAAIDRALTLDGLREAERAAIIVQAVRLGMRTEPNSDAPGGRLDKLIGQLDGLSDAVIEEKFRAHKVVNNGSSREANVIKHSSWIVKTAADPSSRRLLSPSALEDVPSAYLNLARAWANQGLHDRALAFLGRAEAELSEMGLGNAEFREWLHADIDRLRLIGTVGTAITAPHWLNTPAGGASVDLKGQVTLLEFSAHWCVPCVQSYPALNRLRAKYGTQGFQVVLATRLYGYYQKERNLPAGVELERLQAYLREHQLDVPVAVGDPVRRILVDGKAQYLPARDPNERAYQVVGIPQINLIDTKGRIQLVMIGYDDANEPKLEALIERILREK